MKNMGKDFIVGYVFNTLERKIIKALKEDENKSALEKRRSYSADVSIPLQWFCEDNVNNMSQKSKEDTAFCSWPVREVIYGLEEVFADTAFGRNFKLSINSRLDEDRYVKIILDMDRNLKELTMEELEKIVGYPFKIVEKKEEKKSNAFNANAFVMSAIFGWNEEEDI
jgi:hypothetical protein